MRTTDSGSGKQNARTNGFYDTRNTFFIHASPE
jgi:hypothetical protein